MVYGVEMGELSMDEGPGAKSRRDVADAENAR